MTGSAATMRGMETPYGYCHCGCGETTPLNPRNDTRRGYVKGEPRRYIAGHHLHLTRYKRRKGPDYLVEDCGYDSPCWVWQHATRNGYGTLTHNGGMAPAHRVFYEGAKGPVPDGLTLDHLCRNPPCVNPAHLEPVTNAENIRRGKGTKLTWDDVDAIRASPKTRAEIAVEYGLSKGYVAHVRAGRRWAEHTRAVA